ncbi:crooked neck-like protein 1 [Tanacetum coccineum]|uniref:Crooked neck-like protein 1 n=1 Tax=Tanacetum coccineum TaxID=301880 RepID=A0ABQ4YP91_9ASTR
MPSIQINQTLHLQILSEKIFEQVRVNSDIPVKAVQDQLQCELEVQMSMSKAFRAKAKAEREIRGDQGPFPGQVLVAVGLDSNNGIYPLAYALVEAETKSSWYWFLQCLGDDIDLHPNSNFTFISDRQKGIIPEIKTIYPSAEHRYCLRHIHENMKQGWCGQAYKDLLWRAASAINVRDFEKCRAKSDLLLNNIFGLNGKIVRGRDKPVITLLEYIREYCMKRIVNIQGVIDKCTGPLTPTTTRIMEPIKKEAHLMKVQWNGANKYQVSGSLGDQCVVDVVSRPKKKRKRFKHEDEPFVKDGKLSRKGRTITCQSCGNTGHNKATCKGQGRKATTGVNNAEASGSASRQEQQIKPIVVQDGSGGSGVGAVIGLSAAAGEGGAGGPGGAGIAGGASQGSSHTRWTNRIVQTERISPQKRTPTQPKSQPSTSSQVPVSQTRNADGREIGDGVPTQSSAAGGASEWSFLTWKESYSHKIQPICGTKYWEKSTCPTTLLPPKHHVQVGRPRKKRKRSKHKDEPFVKDGKLSRKGRTITCQSCGNTGHNKATCKGQGRKATTVGQDGSGGSGAGVVIGLSAAAGEGGAGVASQGSSRSRWTKRRVQTERISPQKRTPTQPASQPSTSSQVLVSETRNADGREMGDGVPTQSSAAGGASEWSFL